MIKLLLICVLSTSANAAIYCVGSAATGSGNGADWNNKKSWSDTPVRGDTWYIDDGNYASKTFSPALSGTTRFTVKKAIESDHVTDTGWSSTMGDGQAVIDATLRFNRGFITIDGQTGGGPSSWESGHGIKVLAVPGTDAEAIFFDREQATGVDSIYLYHIEVDGGATSGPPYVLGLDIVTLAGDVDDLQIKYGWIHDIPGEVCKGRQWKDSIWEYTKIARNFSDATTHGDGIEAGSTWQNVTIRYCWWEDIKCTYVLGSHMGGSINGFYIYGNLFTWTDDTRDCSDGVFATLTGSGTVNDVLIYNNTFAGQNVGAGGLNIVQTGTAVLVKNNLWWKKSGSSITISFDDTTHDYNAFFGSTDASESNIQETATTTSPFTNFSGDDFTLLVNTSAGTDLGSPYNIDMFGRTRTTWTRGALEFVGEGSIPPTAYKGKTTGNKIIRGNLIYR